MAIIATLSAIAAPRYFNSLEKTKEVALRANLKAMRDAIDQYYQDNGTWPTVLDDLVKKRYLREIPADPITQETGTWVTVKPTTSNEPGIRDVRSGATTLPRDGSRYEDW